MRTYTVISLSMLPKFKKKLDALSKKLNVSRSVLIRKAITDLIDKNPQKKDFKKAY